MNTKINRLNFVSIILAIIVCMTSISVMSCGRKSYQEINDIEYDVSILIPEGMTKEEWMNSILYEGEMECPFTGLNYYNDLKFNARQLADYLLSKNIVIYTGETKKKINEQKDYFSKLIFKWQSEFDTKNNQILSCYKFTDQWVDYMDSKMNDPDIQLKVKLEEYWTSSIADPYNDIPAMDKDFWED